jgi:hypothetical protein
MVQKDDQPPSDRPTPGSPEPRKRFRIEKIEERIAPRGHYNPHSKWVGDGAGNYDSSASGSSGSSGSIY